MVIPKEDLEKRKKNKIKLKNFLKNLNNKGEKKSKPELIKM